MIIRYDTAKLDSLWRRAWAIRGDHASGLYIPILWHLALRRHADAMLNLADTFGKAGRLSDPFSQSGLSYRAFRSGQPLAAQNLAIESFNSGDLRGYRYWLQKAARIDPVYRKELKRFEMRLPRTAARLIRRGRPYLPYDDE